jgi:acyl-CoA thioester hydrolase
VTLQRGQLTDRHAPFKFSAHTRVDFSDTDAQAIVYYGRYLPYFDMARVEYLRNLALLDARGGAEEFVMRALSVEYFAPARFDDPIEIFVRVVRIGRSSVTWAFDARNAEDDRLLVSSSQTAVYIDVDARRAVSVPDGYRGSVQAFERGDLEA